MLTVALIAFRCSAMWAIRSPAWSGRTPRCSRRRAARVDLGLDDPFVVQFARFVGNAEKGDFGISYRQRRPVAELLENAGSPRSNRRSSGP